MAPASKSKTVQFFYTVSHVAFASLQQTSWYNTGKPCHSISHKMPVLSADLQLYLPLDKFRMFCHRNPRISQATLHKTQYSLTRLPRHYRLWPARKTVFYGRREKPSYFFWAARNTLFSQGLKMLLTRVSFAHSINWTALWWCMCATLKKFIFWLFLKKKHKKYESSPYCSASYLTDAVFMFAVHAFFSATYPVLARNIQGTWQKAEEEQ